MFAPHLPILAACCLLAAGFATALTQQRDSADYRVRRTEAAADSLLAGRPDAWAAAASITWGTEPWPTTFRALRTADSLWLRWDAADDSPWHTYTQRDDPLWEEEVVEIFLDPDGDRRNYVEVELSPANVLCDLLMERGDPDKVGHLDWDFPGIESAVHPRADVAGWVAIVRLPWSGFDAVPGTDVTVPPEAGDRWWFNVFRIKRPHGPRDPRRDLVLDAWAPVPGASFHVPEVFRTMEFE